jgi:uncharacterized membrane protein YhaH (DUF805 family)
MIEFLLAGGWSTWMVLILGGTCFAVAALFARRPETRRLPLLRAMTWATVFAVLAGLAANVTATLAHAAAEESAAMGSGLAAVLAGGAEALTSAVLGFTLLALAWMFVAIGMRRLQDPEP